MPPDRLGTGQSMKGNEDLKVKMLRSFFKLKQEDSVSDLFHFYWICIDVLPDQSVSNCAKIKQQNALISSSWPDLAQRLVLTSSIC